VLFTLSMTLNKLSKSALCLSTVLALVHCSSAPAEESTGTTEQDMSTAIHTTYGITTFGGAGDYQTLACTNANSRNDQPWFTASSQRYGCGVHLKLTTASGKCVVARTDDAGPASFVESNAGIAVLDTSPQVTNYLFPGVGELGYSDLHAHPGKYNVTAVTTTLPLGPCDASSSGGTASGGTTSGGTASGGTSSGGSSGGTKCATDGDCNPGNDGSGEICSGGQCVAGCHSNAQCPGNTTCVSGSCK